MVRLFPSVHSGSHRKFPEVEYFQQKRFQLTTQPEVDVDADGKYVCPTPVEIAVTPV
jgi:diacylglycerol kinase family enzyme